MGRVITQQNPVSSLLKGPFAQIDSAFDSLAKTTAHVKARSWPPERTLHVDMFLHHMKEAGSVVFDVRSPSEFQTGHIPGAINLPLLVDSVHAEVGKTFRWEGKDTAFDLALAHVYPGLQNLLQEVLSHAPAQSSCDNDDTSDRDMWKPMVYCKRGGMRSQSVAGFLRQHGLNAFTLQGGYKAFRNWAGEVLERPQELHVIGGPSGSGKTEVLASLQELGHQVLDLEQLACHKGSVFGHLGEKEQPTSEHCRNMVAMEMASMDRARPVFVEDEHARIGSICLDASLYQRMRSAPVVVHMQMSFELRVERLLSVYGVHGKEVLAEVVKMFDKRMGKERTQSLLQELSKGNLQHVCEVALKAYDVSYARHMAKDRDASTFVNVCIDSLDSFDAAVQIVDALRSADLSV
jgi:tRNA 2-selenouridine synthase